MKLARRLVEQCQYAVGVARNDAGLQTFQQRLRKTAGFDQLSSALLHPLLEFAVRGAQRIVGLLAIADVAQVTGKHRLLRITDCRDRKLYRKFTAVGTHRREFDQPIQNALLPSGEIALHPLPMTLTQRWRHDDFTHFAPDDIVARVTKHDFRRRIEIDDLSLVINGHDRIERSSQNRRLAGFAGAQGAFGDAHLGHIAKYEHNSEQ